MSRLQRTLDRAGAHYAQGAELRSRRGRWRDLRDADARHHAAILTRAAVAAVRRPSPRRPRRPAEAAGASKRRGAQRPRPVALASGHVGLARGARGSLRLRAARRSRDARRARRDARATRTRARSRSSPTRATARSSPRRAPPRWCSTPRSAADCPTRRSVCAEPLRDLRAHRGAAASGAAAPARRASDRRRGQQRAHRPDRPVGPSCVIGERARHRRARLRRPALRPRGRRDRRRGRAPGGARDLGRGVQVGARSVLQPGVVIGGDGFGLRPSAAAGSRCRRWAACASARTWRSAPTPPSTAAPSRTRSSRRA